MVNKWNVENKELIGEKEKQTSDIQHFFNFLIYKY